MSRATIAAVRHALRASSDRGALDARLRVAAASACEDAHAAGLKAEEMLVRLKQDWPAHPEFRRLPQNGLRSELTSRFITLCIHQFFAGDNARPHVERRVSDDAAAGSNKGTASQSRSESP
jgi:hypothetical protein